MKTKSSLNMKKKSLSTKNEKSKHNYCCNCPSVWVFVPDLKLKHKRVTRPTISVNETQRESVVEITDKVPTPKILRKSQITRIPKIGCVMPFLVTMFNNLANSGAVRMNESEIMNAVNITAKVKKDLDEGKPWTGTVEITGNLKLKLYKSGLVVYHKKEKLS